MINPPTLPTSPLKIDGLAISIWDPTFNPSIPLPATTPPVIRACICTCIAANYSYCCLIMACKSCWLISYDGSGDGDGDVRSSGMGCNNWAKRTNPMLDSVSNSYSELDIFSIITSGTLLVCLTLSTNYFPTNYYLNQIVNNFDLKRLFYSRQSLKGSCCSSVCTDHKWVL